MIKANNKAIGNIIVAISLLLITSLAFLSIYIWSQDFTSSIATKKLQNGEFIGKDLITIEGLKLESGNYNLYIKSNSAGYEIISEIKVEGNSCTYDSNILLARKTSIIDLTCPSISTSVNDIVIITNNGAVNSKKPLITS